MNYAYVTVLSTNDYYKGVIVLFESLKLTNPKYNNYIVLVNETIDKEIIDDLKNRGYIVIEKPRVDASFIKNEKYKHWSNTFDKFNVFDLTDYNKVVYLDSDMYVYKNIDDLFEYPNMSSTIAARKYYPDWDNLNSGMMVIEPKQGILEGLKELLHSGKYESHIGDQDIIGAYFDWKNTCLELIDKYNVFQYLVDKYIEENVYTREDMNVVHYIGIKKPWMLSEEDINNHREKLQKESKINELYFFDKYLEILNKIK